MKVTIRRARADDLDFLAELVNDPDVEPFFGGAARLDRESLGAEIKRSESEPHVYGRFVIEADGEPAGSMGFEVTSRHSRIAQLERVAVHPALVADLGYHRLQLEIYGFNERAQRHVERAGFVREGVRRKAYRRHGEWMDGVLYAVIADDVDVPDAIRRLHDYVVVHNDCVRSGDWGPLAEWFTDDAELAFEGVPVGPFHGRGAIAAAYRESPPDDEVLVLDADESEGIVVARC